MPDLIESVQRFLKGQGQAQEVTGAIGQLSADIFDANGYVIAAYAASLRKQNLTDHLRALYNKLHTLGRFTPIDQYYPNLEGFITTYEGKLRNNIDPIFQFEANSFEFYYLSLRLNEEISDMKSTLRPAIMLNLLSQQAHYIRTENLSYAFTVFITCHHQIPPTSNPLPILLDGNKPERLALFFKSLNAVLFGSLKIKYDFPETILALLKPYINQAIADETIPSYALLEWLVPKHMDLIEKENMAAAIATLSCFEETQRVADLLAHNAYDTSLMEQAMSTACQYGVCSLVADLHITGANLPDNIEAIMRVYQIAQFSNLTPLIKTIDNHFTFDALLKHAVATHRAGLVNKMIPLSETKQVDDETVLRYIQRLAASNNLDTLGAFLKAFYPNTDDRRSIITQHVIPHFRGQVTPNTDVSCFPELANAAQTYGNQDQFSQATTLAAREVAAAMRAGQFTFSRQQESTQPGWMGPRRLGEMRRLIASLCNSEKAHYFGLARLDRLHTTFNINSKAYHQRAAGTLKTKGTINLNGIGADLGNPYREHQVKIKIKGQTFKLTNYVDRGCFEYQKWEHTSTDELERCLVMLDTLYQDIDQHISALNKEKSVLKAISQLMYLWYHACPYSRGSATVGEWIMTALLDRLGLAMPAKLTLSADRLAITTADPALYQEQFPKIFDCQSYDEMLTKLKQPAGDPVGIEQALMDKLLDDATPNSAPKPGH